jgi:phosphate transport system permease protein
VRASPSCWALAGVFLFLFVEGYPGLSVDEHFYRPFTTFWGYVWPLIFGTTLAAILALLISVPFAIGIALFVSHYAPKALRTPVAYVMDLLAAVPSVVFGLWGGGILAKQITGFQGWLHDTLGFLPFFAGPPVCHRAHHAQRRHRAGHHDLADHRGVVP